MLTINDINFHIGEPRLPTKEETLNGFVTAMGAVSVTQPMRDNPDAMKSLRMKIARGIFNDIYGDILKDLHDLSKQVRDAQSVLRDRPEMLALECDKLLHSIRDISNKLVP